ncbi:MAG: serine/threonine-protein phosphatase [Deltaproteobacteria bacterium]|nr:serine/threonine-protein phosphatase [Deltaproteobacteria bacterium]
MKFFSDSLCQRVKQGHLVCGDYFQVARNTSGTVCVICDGVGSGVYANISAVTCASRLMELCRSGVSVRAASEMVASSMHRARTEDIPFSAFVAAAILPDGQFLCYNYEAPEAVLVHEGSSAVLKPRFYTAGFEVIGEARGVLGEGDALVMFSDGVSQAGMGCGYDFGIGSQAVSAFINQSLAAREPLDALPERIVDMCRSVSRGRHSDDTTLALMRCREAEELTLLTGPPSKPGMDRAYVEDFMAMSGKKIACGSTTADILSRELDRPVEMFVPGGSFGEPPSYSIEGIDLVTEGAVTLNQAYNILDVPEESLSGNSAVEKLCLMLRKADVVHLMIGNAMNVAHEDLLFRQIGVRIRRTTIGLIAETLRGMGKLVTERHY